MPATSGTGSVSGCTSGRDSGRRAAERVDGILEAAETGRGMWFLLKERAAIPSG